MKLECELVQDIYILYKENELSPRVKEAVDSHLHSCSTCQAIYEHESGFPDLYKSTSSLPIEQPQPSLDKRIKRKLTLRKVRAVLLFTIALFLVYGYFQYIDARKNLLYELTSIEQTAQSLYQAFDTLKTNTNEPEAFSLRIGELQEKNTRLVRHLNWLEKRKYQSSLSGLYISYDLNQLISFLHTKYHQGEWTERDEEALQVITGYLEQYVQLLGHERQQINGVYQLFNLTSIFHYIKVNDLAQLHLLINEFSFFYSTYTAFPEEMVPLTQEELQEIIFTSLQVEDGTIQFAELNHEAHLSRGYTFQLRGEKEVVGIVDMYTGYLIEFHQHLPAQGDEELISPERALNHVERFITHNYKGWFEWEIADQGMIEHPDDPERTLRVFHYMPKVSGYKINTLFRLQIDAYTGELYSLIQENGAPFDLTTLTNRQSSVQFDQDEGLNQLINLTRLTSQVEYIDTLWVKSKRTGDYQLVHIYQTEQNHLYYINSHSGKMEVPFNEVVFLDNTP